MSLETKLILEEMQKQFNEQNQMVDKRFVTSESKWEQRFTDLESRGEDRVAKMEKVTGNSRSGGRKLKGRLTRSSWRLGNSPSIGNARFVSVRWAILASSLNMDRLSRAHRRSS
jgi:hypothetical protein